MADITYTSNMTQRTANKRAIAGPGDGSSLKKLAAATIELAGSASGTTLFVGRIPASARLSGLSRLYHDDLATSGSPTFDIGLGSVDENVTSDPDAINDGIAVSSAGADVAVIKDAANIGLPAWDFVNGQTSDPGGELDVYISVKDAATNATGTVSIEIYGYLD